MDSGANLQSTGVEQGRYSIKKNFEPSKRGTAAAPGQ